MRVWLINPFDNLPSEGYRPQRYWLMARAFVKAGHEVVYWTSDFSHAAKQKRNLVREVDDGFAVRMIPTLAYPKNICVKRISSHRMLSHDWYAMAGKELGNPDVVIASSPPLGLCDAARRFARERGAMFVADVQDAWPETFERILPGFVFSLLGMRRMAKRIYCGADGISAVATRYIELAQKYGSNVPCSVFGHCIDMVGKPTRVEYDTQGLRLVYIGNMSLSYDLETVIKAVTGLDGVTLDVAGNGPDLHRLEKLASGVTNINFHGYLDDSALADLLSRCDVGVIPMFANSCVGVPGKIADYAAAHLRIIESLGGETADITDRFCIGAHYKVGDVSSLRIAIESLLFQRPEGQQEAFAAEFDANKVMPRYVKWIEDLIKCRKG